MSTTCAAAIKSFEQKSGENAAEAKIVKLYGQIPPITKLDASLNNLTACEHLQLSTNSIDKISIALTGLKNLKILSLGRNVIKKIERLDDLAENLEELWISYNQISSLDGLSSLTNLTTLFISNNAIKNFAELEKLACLPNLKDVLFYGNPMYEGLSAQEARIEVLKRLPNIAKIDGSMVLQSDRDEAASSGGTEE
uniref:Dynein axonemal light chain 1 n=1 Tax=Aureoumbra lagunensis TaxID=44058 RepID=A0A7S3K2Z4_9STRA|mmetsp:Transcript_7632/g.11470  ORF Transcript_7632/g.11470 Transcript_7632/m.11470 type:complete len:196 (-) Transcript_7632:254-841(-)